MITILFSLIQDFVIDWRVGERADISNVSLASIPLRRNGIKAKMAG